MKPWLCLFMLLLSLTASTLAYAQGAQGEKKARTIDDYRPRTLRELSTMLPDNFRKALDESAARGQGTRIIVHGELFPSRVKVVYGEMKRPILAVKKDVVISWANQFAGMPEFYTAPYETEMLFTEDGQNYWLAVRKEFVAQEWKQGETVELCVIKLGATRVGDEMEPVLLVEKVVPSTR